MVHWTGKLVYEYITYSKIASCVVSSNLISCFIVLLLLGDSGNNYSCGDILLLRYAHVVDGQ